MIGASSVAIVIKVAGCGESTSAQTGEDGTAGISETIYFEMPGHVTSDEGKISS